MSGNCASVWRHIREFLSKRLILVRVSLQWNEVISAQIMVQSSKSSDYDYKTPFAVLKGTQSLKVTDLALGGKETSLGLLLALHYIKLSSKRLRGCVCIPHPWIKCTINRSYRPDPEVTGGLWIFKTWTDWTRARLHLRSISILCFCFCSKCLLSLFILQIVFNRVKLFLVLSATKTSLMMNCQRILPLYL